MTTRSKILAAAVAATSAAALLAAPRWPPTTADTDRCCARLLPAACQPILHCSARIRAAHPGS